MAQTYLAVVGHRAGDAERLQADTDGLGSLRCVLAAFLQRNGATYHVGPLCILEADGLRLFTRLVRIQTIFVANLVGLFDVLDAIFVQRGKNLLDAAVLAFEFHFSNHDVLPPYFYS